MARFWFKPKSFGYGVTPETWEGWAFSLGMAIAIIASGFVMIRLLDRADTVAWLIWALADFVLFMGLVAISRAKSDGEWRWRR